MPLIKKYRPLAYLIFIASLTACVSEPADLDNSDVDSSSVNNSSLNNVSSSSANIPEVSSASLSSLLSSSSAESSSSTPSSSSVPSSSSTLSSTSAPSSSSSASPVTWKECAVERNTCYFEGTATVRFGAAGAWVEKEATEQIDCIRQAFGEDPVPGSKKTCQVPENVVVITPSPTEPASFKPLLTSQLLYSHTLTDSSHVSDGTDREKDGERRFAGVMGAHAVTYKGFQYVLYYTGKNRNRNNSTAKVMVARRNVATNNWKHAQIKGYEVKSEDGHNRNAIAISEGDGVIHLSFDHHNSRVFNYAKSAKGAADRPNATAWNDDTLKLNKNLGLSARTFDQNIMSVTYPAFQAFPGGNLVVNYRGGGANNGAMVVAKYDAIQSKWLFARKFSSPDGRYRRNSSTRGPYTAGGVQPMKDGKMKVAWLWREQEGGCASGATAGEGCNHGLYFAQSPDQGVSWYDKDNKLLANTNQGEMISINAIDEVVVITPEKAPSNVAITSGIDHKTGDFHVLSRHKNNNGRQKLHHYIGSEDGTWTSSESTFSASNITLTFVDDYAFALAGRTSVGLYVSSRAQGFNDWKKIEIPNVPGPNGTKQIDGGYSTWDVGRLANEGIASVIWHTPTTNALRGDPSPVWVYDFKVADVVEGR